MTTGNSLTNNKTKILALTGLMAAIIAVATGFLKVPTPLGYIHLGDGFIFLAAACLGPYGAVAAALGSGLADLFAGYLIYAPATFIIKGLMGWIAYLALKKGSGVGRCLVTFILAEAVMILGYFGFEIMLYGFAAAVAAITFNCVQASAGIVIGTFAVMVVAKREHGKLLYNNPNAKLNRKASY